jgi:hypothetical protein
MEDRSAFIMLIKANLRVLASEIDLANRRLISYVSIKQRPDPDPPQLTNFKGAKREIFVAGIFAEIRPIWLGYLVTRPKNPKKLHLGPYITLYFPRFLF